MTAIATPEALATISAAARNILIPFRYRDAGVCLMEPRRVLAANLWFQAEAIASGRIDAPEEVRAAAETVIREGRAIWDAMHAHPDYDRILAAVMGFYHEGEVRARIRIRDNMFADILDGVDPIHRWDRFMLRLEGEPAAGASESLPATPGLAHELDVLRASIRPLPCESRRGFARRLLEYVNARWRSFPSVALRIYENERRGSCMPVLVDALQWACGCGEIAAKERIERGVALDIYDGLRPECRWYRIIHRAHWGRGVYDVMAG